MFAHGSICDVVVADPGVCDLFQLDKPIAAFVSPLWHALLRSQAKQSGHDARLAERVYPDLGHPQILLGLRTLTMRPIIDRATRQSPAGQRPFGDSLSVLAIRDRRSLRLRYRGQNEN
jgi:hypothetical protein